jgi:hypothetical protein
MYCYIQPAPGLCSNQQIQTSPENESSVFQHPKIYVSYVMLFYHARKMVLRINKNPSFHKTNRLTNLQNLEFVSWSLNLVESVVVGTMVGGTGIEPVTSSV